MKQSVPIRINKDVLERHVAAVREAGCFSSDTAAINALIKRCAPLFVRSFQQQQALLDGLAVAAPSAPAPAAAIAPLQPDPKPGTSPCFGNIDPSQLDDF